MQFPKAKKTPKTIVCLWKKMQTKNVKNKKIQETEIQKRFPLSTKQMLPISCKKEKNFSFGRGSHS